MDPEPRLATSPDALDTLHWLAMPVVVVGAAVGDERSCATGTLSYVSLSPPMIATSMARTSHTYQLAHDSQRLSISFLRDDQADVATSAARHLTTSDKFHELSLATQERSGVPALLNCGAVLWCSVEQEHAVGDSVLCVGRVISVTSASDKEPLLRFGGHYHALGASVEAPGELPYPL